MNIKKRLSLYIILLALVISVMIAIRLNYFTPEKSTRDYPEIRKEGILRMAIDYNPLSYNISGDTLIGFEYEMAQLLSRVSGLEVQLYPVVSLDKSIEGLQNNEYDIVGRLIPVTSNNKENLSFIDPLILNKQVLVQRKADYNDGKAPIKNQLLLAQKKLHIISDLPTELRIRNLSHEIGDTIYTVPEKDYGYEQLIILVAKGEIDYAVSDLSIARKMGEIYPEIDYDTDISFHQFQSWPIRKDATELKDSLNNWFSRIRSSDEFKNITDKYYHNASVK